MTRSTESTSAQQSSALFSNDSTPEHAGVLRIAKIKHGWVPIPRELINDQRLQFDTRAIAAWLLSRGDGWEIRLSALPRVLQRCGGPGEKTGRDRVRRCMRELDAAGYLTRSRSRAPGGRWVWRADLRNSSRPMAGTATMDGSAVDGQGVDLSNTLSSLRSDYIETTTTTPTAPLAKADDEPVVVGLVKEIRIESETNRRPPESAETSWEPLSAGDGDRAADDIAHSRTTETRWVLSEM